MSSKYVSTLLVLTILISTPTLIYQSQAEAYWDPYASEVVGKTIQSLSMDNIRRHVEFFSTLKSRVVGYPGYYKAVDYIYRYLSEELGLNTWVWDFDVLVPIDHGSTLTVLTPEHRVLKVYALMPNGVQTCKTPPGGLTGRLIYVGDGYPEDFDGFKVEGSIVLMKFNSKGNWVNAMRFGAKAVVFLGWRDTIRGECDLKAVTAPIKFPRVLISDEDAKYLLKLLEPDGGKTRNVTVRLEVNMLWERIKGKNMFAVIPGAGETEKPELVNQTIMVAAYFDSSSVVPAIAPGAQESLGVSTLLEYARILKEKPPYRPVIVGFFSGQPFAMAGARAWAEDLIFRHWTKDRGKLAEGSRETFIMYGDRIRLIFVLDFSTRSSSIVLTLLGTHVGGWDLTEARGWRVPDRYLKPPTLAEVRELGEISYFGVYDELLNYHELPGGRKYRVYFNLRPWLRVRLPGWCDHIGEIFSQAGILAITFFTADDARILWTTPADRVEYVNFENLRLQAEYSLSMVNLVVNDRRRRAEKALENEVTHAPSRDDPRGFALVKGRVGRFNFTRNWYEYDWDKVLGNDGQLVVSIRLISGMILHNHEFIVEADRYNGSFTIYGLRPGWWAARPVYYEVAAFVLNRTTGNVEWAPDIGEYGRKLWPFGPVFNVHGPEVSHGELPVHIALFRAGAIALHDVVDPRTLSAPLSFMVRPMEIRIYDVRTHVQPVQFSYYAAFPFSPLLVSQAAAARGIGDPVLSHDVVVFIPPETPTEIVFLETGLDIPLGIIRNVSAQAGEYLDIPFTAFGIAGEFLSLAEERVQRLKGEAAVAQTLPPALDYYNKASSMYETAYRAVRDFKYSEAYASVFRSWFYSRESYRITKAVYLDIVYTVIFFFVLLIPFALLLERLIFHKEGVSRIAYTSLIFALSLIGLYVLHPGLRLTHNALVAILGLLVAILVLPILGLIITGFWEVTKLIRRRIIGRHFIEVARTAELASAVSMGVENMRRMKLRTVLTLTTIILMIFSLTSFTAITFVDIPRSVDLNVAEEYIDYSGILIKGLATEERVVPLTPEVYEQIRSILSVEAVVAPRAWLMLPHSYLYASDGNGNEAVVKAIMGLTPQEVLGSRLFKYMVDPRSRWFEPDDMFVAIVTKDIADGLNVTVGDLISVAGVSLHLIGVLEVNLDVLTDIDGLAITPLDRTLPLGSNIPASDGIIFIPFELAIRMGALIPSVVVGYKDPELAKERAFQLSEQLSGYLSVYYSDRVSSYKTAWLKGYEVFGLEFMLPSLVIVSLIMLNVMLGQVYERLRYISIYSSIGLSPMHVATMFMVESTVFAVLGAALGYILALLTGALITTLAPGMIFINYASIYVILSAAISMLTVIVSSVYPAIKASRFVTPSLERVWRIPTKPRENLWSIPLPFVISEDDVMGCLAYISEYIVKMGTEAGKFMVEAKPRYRVKKTPKAIIRELESVIRLPPYEAGVTETITISAVKFFRERRYKFELTGRLRTGKRYIWVMGHRTFTDLIRKQLLLWRSLRSKERKFYVENAEKMLEQGG